MNRKQTVKEKSGKQPVPLFHLLDYGYFLL